MLDADRERGLLDLLQLGCLKELRRGGPHARRRAATRPPRADRARAPPPRSAQRALTARVIPDARRHDAALARHARHLAQPCHGVCHEVNDELGEGGVEGVALEREVLRGRLLHADAWVSLEGGRDEGLRGIDGRHGRRSQPPDQLARERTRTAPDVEHALAGLDSREIGEQRGERHRVPAHEPVVCVSRDDEAHRRNLTRGASASGRGRACRRPTPRPTPRLGDRGSGARSRASSEAGRG